MARLLTQFSPTGRDRAHERLGVLQANLNSLLERRWVANYQELVRNITQLDMQIQNLRWWNIDDLIARGGVEAARHDMQRLLNEFIARVETNPPGIQTVAQAINPNINIPAFNRSPAREFGLQATQQIIEQLREWNGPVIQVQQAVEQSQNTDLYVLFALYTAARTTFQRLQNPAQVQANQAQVEQLTRQRAHLLQVRDELARPYNAYNREETGASWRTWASRGLSLAVWAAVWATIMVATGNKANTPSNTWAQNIPGAVNQANQRTIHGHSLSTQGTSLLLNSIPGKAIKIGGELFQFNVVAQQNGSITGTVKETSTNNTLAFNSGKATYNWNDIEVKLVNGRIIITYNNDSVTF